MALVTNDIGPISLKKAVNFTLLAAVFIIGGIVLYKQIRRTFMPTITEAGACKPDPNYEYKDPAKHPNDCQ